MTKPRTAYRFSGAAIASVAILMTACGGGSTPPPDDPSNQDDVALLEDSSGETAGPTESAPASSADVERGKAALQNQDFKAAQEIFTKAHADNPEDPQAAFYLGVSHDGQGNAEQASIYYRKALELDPKLIDASLNLSAVLLNTGKGAEALKVLDAALKQAPQDEQLQLNRAMALGMSGDAKGAAEAYGALIEKKGKVGPDLLYGYAEALVAADDAAKAKEVIGRLLKSKRWEVIISAADLLQKLKAFDDCIKALDTAIAEKPRAELHVLRGRCRRGAKDNPGAKKDFEAAIQVNDKYAQAYYYLGRHLQKVDRDKAGAKKNFEKVLELAGAETVYGQLATRALKEM